MFALGNNLRGRPELSTIHSHGFVMALLQWHKVYKFSEDELHRPPVVALIFQWVRVSRLLLQMVLLANGFGLKLFIRKGTIRVDMKCVLQMSPTCTNHVNSARSPRVLNRKPQVLCKLCLVGKGAEVRS